MQHAPDWRSVLPVRMALCLAISALVICMTFVAVAFAEKVFHDGPMEALGRVIRAATHVTVRELVRTAILSAALGSIACFPVYFNPAQAHIRPGLMILYAALAPWLWRAIFRLNPGTGMATAPFPLRD